MRTTGERYRFTTTNNPNWITIAPTYVAGTPEDQLAPCNTSVSYRIFSEGTNASAGPSLYMLAWLNNLGFRPHFWELRCVASGTVLLDGQTTNVSGVSRTIPFKEMWNGIDYPTDVIPILP
jgi:hypothetical protein